MNFKKMAKPMVALAALYVLGGLLASVTYVAPHWEQFSFPLGKYGFIAGFIWTFGISGLYYLGVKKFGDHLWPAILVGGSQLVLITDYFVDGKRGLLTWGYGVLYIAVIFTALYFLGKWVISVDN